MLAAKRWSLRFRRWAPLAIALLALVNLRLAWRGVAVARGAPSFWNSPWHESKMAELKPHLPPKVVLGYAPDPRGEPAERMVEFDLARFYLAPWRVTKSKAVDWLIVHSDRAGYFPAGFQPRDFRPEFKLDGELTVYRRLPRSR